jgi:hypothetical protein
MATSFEETLIEVWRQTLVENATAVGEEIEIRLRRGGYDREMERALLIERVRSGMARARAEGRQIGRARLDVDREQMIHDRRSGMSLTQIAKKHRISRASVCRLMKEAGCQPNAFSPVFAERAAVQASAAVSAQ